MNDLSCAGVKQPSHLSLAQQLARHASEVPYEAIPADALDAAKLFMLDTLAVSWAGSDAPGCREAHAFLVEEGGREDSSAWAYGGRLPAGSCAFINGMSSAALDYDALGDKSSVHVNITVLPAALALAERERASGREFLAALVAGSDIMYRLGASSTDPHQGFSFTSIFGVFGAAAAGARLLGLDSVATQNALGIAFIQAGGTQQANIEPALTKRMLSAFAARAGVQAALLAKRGLTGPREFIEGKFGIHNLYQKGSPQRLTEELGHRFDNGHLTIKKFPSCGCNHTSLEATLRLVNEHNLEPQDVISIEATVSPYIDRIVGGPYDPSGDAQVAAQFNIRYSIACALVRRRLGLAEIQEQAARDPEILLHVPKVSVRVDPGLNGQRGPVIVRMQTRTNGELSCRVDHVPGSVEAPLSKAEIDEKLRECFKLGVRPLTDDQISALVDRVRTLDRVADMSRFFDGIF